MSCWGFGVCWVGAWLAFGVLFGIPIKRLFGIDVWMFVQELVREPRTYPPTNDIQETYTQLLSSLTGQSVIIYAYGLVIAPRLDNNY